MNFKKLIKIPTAPAPQTDIPAETTVFVKSQYSGGYNKTIKNYLYCAEIIDDMLVVTAYHGGEFKWRTFITDTEYCTQKAGNPKESTASVERILEYGQACIPIDGADKTVEQYVDMLCINSLPPANYWRDLEQGMKTVNSLQARIRNKKTSERHRKIREATEECMLEIRPPVKAFTEWLKRQNSKIYVIYHTGESFGVCSHCLKKVERGKSKWKHREHIICPHCRKKAQLLCSGKFKDGMTERHTEWLWYAQKTSEGCCARLFRANYFLCKGTEYGSKESSIPITRDWNTSTDCIEVGRVFLDFKGGCIKKFIWDNFMNTGKFYWCSDKCNDTVIRGKLYTGNLRTALRNYEQLGYMPWNKISRIAGSKFTLPHIIHKAIRCPWIEYLVKVGMNILVYDYLNMYHDEISVTEFVNVETGTVKNASLAHILGLNRRELREIMPYDPDQNELELYKLLLRNRAGIEEWKKLREFSKRYSAISSALEYQPVSRYLRYIEEQAKQYIQQERGGIKDVISDYADYIQEAKQANYNMNDTATINPKSLIAAHADSEIDSRLEKYKRDYSKYAGELCAAAKNIAKLRGITYEDKQYRIAPIMSWEELFGESKYLRHCVASYAKKYSDGICVIFGIRNADTPDMPMYTLELSGDLQYVRQCRGFKNKSAPENIMKFVEKWHKNLLAKNIKKAG